MTSVLAASDAEHLRECMADGGVAVFPTDTVYGLCCDPDNENAARRLYALKGRPSARASAVMFFDLQAALEVLGKLGDSERLALRALLPGPVTVLLENDVPRFPAACRTDPATLGLRVPALTERLVALGSLIDPVMQSSANISGEPDARSLAEVPRTILDGVDLVLDGGELPGTPSTVIDLRDLSSQGRWHLLREGAMAREAVEQRLAALL
ncbi:MAG: L-threonylcarbamoyladenylate synthase [Actinomycetota bacterium]|nr:L-threonylcarbamoyladenylate synthase [Actinomycetota bacterium]